MVLPEAVRGSVVELRVHGVSGTPPEELLDRQLVRQVAGDKTAGFYRPRLREEWRDRPTNDPETDFEPYSIAAEAIPPPLLEGYSWGGLTSGSPSRALWLILLPFTLINVAPRMRPVPGDTPDDSPMAAWWVWFLGRVMAVSLTVTITLGGTGVGLAILAWQCSDVCLNLPWPLSAMFLGTPAGWRVVWGASLPLAMVGLLALLSWRKSVQYDLIRPIGMNTPTTDPAELGSSREPRLGDPSFWYGRFPVSRLRHLHLQAGVAVVGFSLVLSSASSGWRTGGLVLAGIIAGLVLAGLGWGGLLRRADIPGETTSLPTALAKAINIGWILLIWVPVVAILILGLALPHRADGEMGGYDELVTTWFAGQSALTLVMFAVIAMMAMAEKPRTPGRAMGGLGTVVLTILALYLGAAVTSGFVILSAAWITSSTPWIGIGDVQALLAPSSPIEVPSSLQFAGLGTFVVAVVVMVVLALTACHAGWMWAIGGSTNDRAHAAEAEQQAKVEYPRRFAQHRPGTIRRRRTSIARSFWLARRADFLPGYLAALVLAIGLVGSVLTIAYGLHVGLQEDDFAGMTFTVWTFLGLAPINPVAIGVWLIGILSVALVVVGALAFRAPKTRKAVGILWDLGSFWPRDVHPLAPPCYAERTVPELAMRLAEHAAMVSNTEGPADAELLADTPGFVVLASHSQGTVISMAALLGPGRNSADRTVLLTFGTVLRRLYARFFPLYFSSGAFAAVARRLGEPDGWAARPDPWAGDGAGLVSPSLRWRNLWRRSDYLGGRLGDPLADQAPAPEAPEGFVQLDVEFVDPLFLPGRGDSTMPAAGRHSNFPRDPAFQAQLMQLVRASFRALDPALPPIPTKPVLGPTDDLMNPRESMG